MISFPNAKINLGLNITSKRPDGYHNLETVFYPIPLEDALEIHETSSSGQKCNLFQYGDPIAGDIDSNLVVKAYNLLDNIYTLPHINIYLNKHIPSGAGLGGGSPDAAFMLCSLNEKFGLNISINELEGYAASLGADCAFFIQNKPTFAEGIGNIFSPIELTLSGYQFYLIKPSIFVSTRDAFKYIKPQEPEFDLRETVNLPIKEWKNRMFNDFEYSVFKQYPLLKELKEELYAQGAIYAAMSGSGSSIFGIFPANNQYPNLEANDSFVFKTVL